MGLKKKVSCVSSILLLAACGLEIRDRRHDGDLNIYKIGTVKPAVLNDTHNRLYIADNYYLSISKEARVIHGIIGGYYSLSPSSILEVSLYIKLLDASVVEDYIQHRLDDDSFWNADSIIFFGVTTRW